MDVKTLLSILSSPETRELLMKAVDFARVKGQVKDLQAEVRSLQADQEEDARDIEKLAEKMDGLARGVEGLRGRAILALTLGGGAFLLALVALILALR